MGGRPCNVADGGSVGLGFGIKRKSGSALQRQKPDLFGKQPYNHAGCDSYATGIIRFRWADSRVHGRIELQDRFLLPLNLGATFTHCRTITQMPAGKARSPSATGTAAALAAQ
jgi:hypothetical protein